MPIVHSLRAQTKCVLQQMYLSEQQVLMLGMLLLEVLSLGFGDDGGIVGCSDWRRAQTAYEASGSIIAARQTARASS